LGTPPDFIAGRIGAGVVVSGLGLGWGVLFLFSILMSPKK